MARSHTAALRKQAYKNGTYWGSKPTQFVRAPLVLNHSEPQVYWQNGHKPIDRALIRAQEINATHRIDDAQLLPEFNPETQKWESVPAEGVGRFYFNWRAYLDPTYFDLDITIDWPGDCVYTATGVSNATVTTTANSIRVVWSDYVQQQLDLAASVELTSVGTTGAARPRIYRTSDAAKLDAGQLLTDEAIEYWGKATAIRAYQQQDINNQVQQKADQIALPDDYFAGTTITYQSTTTPVQNYYAREGMRDGWPIEFIIQQAIECNNIAYFQLPPLLDFPALTGLPGGGQASDWYNYGNTDPAATLAATTEWALMCARIVDALNNVTDKDGNKYPLDRYVIISIGNEMFNNAAPYYRHNNAYQALGNYLGITAGREQFGAYAYQMAKLQVLLVAALAAGGRSAQKLMLPLETNVTLPNIVDSFEAGILAYEAATSNTVDRSLFYVSPSNYWRVIYYDEFQTLDLGTSYSNDVEYYTAFAAAIDDAVLNGTEDALYEKMYQAGLANTGDNSINSIITSQAETYTLAKSYGYNVGMCYEGDCHDNDHMTRAELDLENNEPRRIFFANWFAGDQLNRLRKYYIDNAWKHHAPDNPFFGVCNFMSFFPNSLPQDVAQDPWFERAAYSDPDNPADVVHHALAQINSDHRAVMGGEL